jgi:hypothetical protein
MIEVPEQFRPHIKVEYPPGNRKIFEEYFNETQVVHIEREQLPINWTSYYVNHQYGKDRRKIQELQEFINSLDKSKKYFTVLQYDDSILNNISGLDIKVFGSGGGRIDSPIALLTAPHPYNFPKDKPVFCSFSGSITHSIREQIVRLYKNKFTIKKGLPIKPYCELMARSTFSMCPRGYGKTSFRICEALQYGAIPVYISDDFIIPYGRDFNEYGVLIHSDQIRDVEKILRSFTREQIAQKQEAGRKIYEELYTFEGARKWILENI